MTVTSIDAGEVDRRIGVALKLLVRAQGRTMKDLATAVGISYPSINERLVGKRHFQAYELVALAAELGVEPGVLYRGADLLRCTKYQVVQAGGTRWDRSIWRNGEFPLSQSVIAA